MRLINTKTFQLEEFYSDIPAYAILSHTWGEEEVSFQDWQANFLNIKQKAGFAKIEGSCQEAIRQDLDYLWCDTNCIDKTSSAELSEAINSMFNWYKNSAVCLAYLADVPPLSGDGQESLVDFRKSRWFTRGWTLQELLAPDHLIFFASDWTQINDRSALAPEIASFTGIRKPYLDSDVHLDGYSDVDPDVDPDVQSGVDSDIDLFVNSDGYSDSVLSDRSYGDEDRWGRRPLSMASVAEKMSWLSLRETTRIEDLAYCMLGIFDINMPLLYGEGQKAFTRLQEEIIRISNDQTIFCWHWNDQYVPKDWGGILSPSPRTFQKSGNYCKNGIGKTTMTYTVTNAGLLIELPVFSCKPCAFAVLEVRHAENPASVAIPLSRISGKDIYRRCCFPPCPVPAPWGFSRELKFTIYINIRELGSWQYNRTTTEELDFDLGAIITATSKTSLKLAPCDSIELFGSRVRRLPTVLKLSRLGEGDMFGGVLGIFGSPNQRTRIKDDSWLEGLVGLVYIGVRRYNIGGNWPEFVPCCKVLGLKFLKHSRYRSIRDLDDYRKPLDPDLVDIFNDRVTSAELTLRDWMEETSFNFELFNRLPVLDSDDNQLKTPNWDASLTVSAGYPVSINTRSRVFMVNVDVRITERGKKS